MKRIIVVFLMLASLKAYAEQTDVTYVCTIEASTGFRYADGKWRAAQFDEAGQKFVLRTLRECDPGFNNKDETPYGVFEVGDKIPRLFCSSNHEPTRIECSGLGSMLFSTETHHFLRIYPFGAVFPEDDQTDSPKMMRGSCLRVEEQTHY